MRASVTVRVPGSTSNLGAGFDCIGVAVERWLTLTARAAEQPAGGPVTLERRGTLSTLTAAPEHDLLYRGFVQACRAARRAVPPTVVLSAESSIPVARGLGSSAAAAVAGAGAAAALLAPGLRKDGLTPPGTQLQSHPDNPAPARYRGADTTPSSWPRGPRGRSGRRSPARAPRSWRSRRTPMPARSARGWCGRGARLALSPRASTSPVRSRVTRSSGVDDPRLAPADPQVRRRLPRQRRGDRARRLDHPGAPAGPPRGGRLGDGGRHRRPAGDCVPRRPRRP